MPSRRVMIVTPSFPPVNAPDMQRVRQSLPFYADFGWDPYVLAVRPEASDQIDSLLEATVPAGIPIRRVAAVPKSWSRALGIGNAAIRAWPFLLVAGHELIRRHKIDLVYFSTTMFLSLPMGRLWKRWTGAPYVVDMQDPWVTDYYDTHPGVAPPKYGLARRAHALLEPWTMREADGLIAVSPDYVETLHQRYPQLRSRPSAVLPFGVATTDFDLVARQPQANPFFTPGSGVHGVYTGAGGSFMKPALTMLFEALKRGLADYPQLFEPLALHFIGTSYAGDQRARDTVKPVAESTGVAGRVFEQTARVPYFQSLQLARDADFLLLIGSDDPSYNASKLHTYVLSEKPLLAVVHQDSVMAAPLRAGGASVATFGIDGTAEPDAVAELVCAWRRLLESLPTRRSVPASFQAFSARELTRRQCEVFNQALQH